MIFDETRRKNRCSEPEIRASMNVENKYSTKGLNVPRSERKKHYGIEVYKENYKLRENQKHES